MKIIKVVVLYRVIQHWRCPMFQRISNLENIDLKVFYGADFKGTKVVSGDKIEGFKSEKLYTIKIKKKHNGIERQMPFCPTLFFHLIKENPDVILTEGKSNFANAILGFIYAKLFRKRIIWWGLGKLRNETLGSNKDKFVQNIEKKCDAQLVYSSVGKDYYESIGIPSSKIFTAVNVVETERIKAIMQSQDYQFAVASKDSSFNVLYVGAVNKNKRIELLINAFAAFSKDKNDVKLTLVGDGSYLQEIKVMIKEKGLVNVETPGQVINGLYKYFANADVFVLPGLGGLAISEAMSFGLPIICSFGDGCEVDLVDATNGFRDPNLNEQSLCLYLENLYHDRILLANMKASSLAKIANVYNVNTYINAINECIKKVANFNCNELYKAGNSTFILF